MNLEMLIEALQEFIERDKSMKYAAVTNSEYFSLDNVYLDTDENGDTVVVID